MADAFSPDPAEARAFDFLEGRWDALCRFPRPGDTWGEGTGSLVATRLLDGLVSVELFEGPYLGQRIKGLGLRAFDPTSRCWVHTWTDTASPGDFHVWRGRFEGDTIRLLADWDDDGARVHSRLTWSRITATSAHWESHRSQDGGRTWDAHWGIDFTRAR